MAPSSPAADVASFYIRELGALLAGVAFLFLWRRSRVAYFGLLAAAFAMRIVAGIFVFEWWSPSHSAWLSLYAAFEFAVLAAIVPRSGGRLRHGRFQGHQRQLRPPGGRRNPAQRRAPAASLHPPRGRGLPVGRRRVRDPIP